MTQIWYIISPVGAILFVLSFCLACWRLCVYHQRRQRMHYVQPICSRRPTVRRHTIPRQPLSRQAPPTARVLRVERCVTDDGAYAQRTSYALERQGMPTQQFQRTVVIRPADNRRPNDPNLPPSYDTAITGKDKSVKVEENGPRSEPTLSPGMGSPSHSPLPPPSAPLYEFSTPPVYTGVSQALPTLPTAPEEKENQVEDSDTALLLP